MKRAVVVIASVMVACSSMPSGDGGVTSDAGTSDAGFIDAGSLDAGFIDAGAVDAGSLDAGALDAGSTDAGPVDGGSIDSGSLDAGSLDAGSPDSGTPDAGTCGVVQGHDLTGATRLIVTGDPGNAALGYGDPSFVYPADASVGFMSYTAVRIGETDIRVATSTDHGATWTYLQSVASVTPITISTVDPGLCGAAMCSGDWVHEVSNLIEDPTDPDPNRRFKLFVHGYFISAAGVQRYEIGSIDVFTTALPSASAVWVEQRLLGWNSSSPRSSTGVAVNVSTDATLAPLLGNCFAMTEPGALVRGSTIDLALGCTRYTPPTAPIEVKLIRSTDHGATWFPVSMLLSLADATEFGASGIWGPQINGPALFQSGGQTYLFATPTGTVANLGPTTTGYRGCLLFRFSDLDAGVLERCGAVPRVVDQIIAEPGLFHGACAYAEGASANKVVVLSSDGRRTPPFQFFSTPISVP